MTQTEAMRPPGTARRRRVGALVLLTALTAVSACSDANPSVLGAASPRPATSATASAGSASVSASPSAVASTAPRATGSPAAPGTTAPAPAALRWTACGNGFQCATLPVPLVAGDPGKGTVELALTRRRATSPSRRIGSLLINPGGPGASAVGYLQAAYTAIPADVRARFDLVAFDPRGVGRSRPVRCGTTAELDRYFALDPTPDNDTELKALQQGNSDLVAGCLRRSSPQLPFVATVDTARDMDAVRAAVGDDKLSYLGYSYGTTLGAAYLDAYPTKVRAMVLDGGIDPTLSWDQFLAGQSTGFDRAFEAFLKDCQATNCAYRKAVEGDLLQAFDRLQAQVEQTPLPTGQARDLGPGEFSLGVGAGLYSKSSGWPAIAAGLAAAENGDGAPLLALNDQYLDRTPSGYENVTEANLAVNCIDRPWPRETQPYLDLRDKVSKGAPRFGPAIALSGLACADWPVAAVSRPHEVQAPGAPPVVVIGTTGDPATPYAWSVALADQLSSGVLLTHRGDGHTVYRVGAPGCILSPVSGYLLTTKAPAAATC